MKFCNFFRCFSWMSSSIVHEVQDNTCTSWWYIGTSWWCSSLTVLHSKRNVGNFERRYRCCHSRYKILILWIFSTFLIYFRIFFTHFDIFSSYISIAGKDDVFGENPLSHPTIGKSCANVRAITYCDLHKVSVIEIVSTKYQEKFLKYRELGHSS